MNYNLDNYSWGNYQVAAEKNNIKVESNNVGVNIMEILTRNIKAIWSANSGSRRSIDLHVIMSIALHDNPDSDTASILFFNGLIGSTGSPIANLSVPISVSENNEKVINLDTTFSIFSSARQVHRYIYMTISVNGIQYSPYQIDLSELGDADKIILNLDYLQDSNGGNLHIVLNPAERFLDGMDGVAVSIVDGSTGEITEKNAICSGSIFDALVGNGFADNSEISVNGLYKQGATPVKIDFPVYLLITYENGAVYNYVNISTPVLSYNSELNSLEWDAVQGAEQYEIIRNDVVIATLDENGEVKTS